MKRKREKQKTKNKNIAPLDDDGAIVHCSMANSVQAPEKLTAETTSLLILRLTLRRLVLALALLVLLLLARVLRLFEGTL